MCQGLWRYAGGGMGPSIRTHISRADMKVEADCRGIHVGEFELDVFRICESVVREQDFQRAKNASKGPNTV